MYAVIETGGKQYRVEVGTELAVELLDAQPGESITIDRVLLVADGAERSIGRPLVDGASVAAEVLRQDLADKVISFKYRPKARRRVKRGHRQDQTILRVTDVVVGGRSAAEAARKAEADAKTERERLEEAAARQAAEDAALAAKLAARAAQATKPATATDAEPAGEEPKAEGVPKARATRRKVAETVEAGDAAEAVEPAPKKTRAKASPEESGDAPTTRRARTKKDE